jgi:2-methylcitrate dehydratase PrpD
MNKIKSKKEDGITRRWTAFVCGTTFSSLGDDVIRQTKNLILDHIGNTLAGFCTEYGGLMVKLVESLGGKPESTVFGTGKKTSCANAAFANARMSNALDNDEILYNKCHVGPVPISSALAVGEKIKAGGKDVILATALGYDFGARFCMAAPAGLPKDPLKGEVGAVSGYGYNTIASAIPAGKLLGLDKEKMAYAIGAAAWYSPISLNWKWMNELPLRMMKYSDLGWIAQAGIIAVLLVQNGLTASSTILDDDFLRTALGNREYHRKIMTEDLGSKWHIMSSGIKLYPV